MNRPFTKINKAVHCADAGNYTQLSFRRRGSPSSAVELILRADGAAGPVYAPVAFQRELPHRRGRAAALSTRWKPQPPMSTASPRRRGCCGRTARPSTGTARICICLPGQAVLYVLLGIFAPFRPDGRRTGKKSEAPRLDDCPALGASPCFGEEGIPGQIYTLGGCSAYFLVIAELVFQGTDDRICFAQARQYFLILLMQFLTSQVVPFHMPARLSVGEPIQMISYGIPLDKADGVHL